MITIIHPIESPSGNRFAKKHWSIPSKWKRQCFTWAVIVFRNTHQLPAIGKRRVRFTSYRKRLLDNDNLISGYKYLLDALVHAGYLVDDSPAYGTFEYSQVISKKPYYTKIEIIDA